MIILVLSLFILYTLLAAFVSAMAMYLMMIRYRKPQWLPVLYPINVSMDCFFTVNEKKAIIKSLMQWQEATHGLVTFRIVNMNAKRLVYNKEDETSGYTINFVRALSKDKEVKEWDEKYERTVLGYAQGYEPCGLAFMVADRLYDNSPMFTATCGHEIGHLLGLPHNPNKNTLMYKYINTLKPTQHDVRELILLWRNWINR